jgi:threonine dehydrogenase-like Zn-dependent dehydrogenase
MTSLRRITFVAPEQVQVETIETELMPAPDQALIRTHYSFISAGTELAVYTNTNELGRSSSDQQYPAYPGYAASGIVEAVGDNVKRIAPGSRIVAATGHASHARFQPDRTVYLELPEAFPPEHAPFIRMALIPLAALQQADIHAGEWLGVVGLGVVGNLGAQFGRAAGYRVVGIGRSKLRNQIAAQCGIAPILTGDADDIARETKTLTSNRGCRFVLETTGTAEGLQKALALVGDSGTISLVGVPWQQDDRLAATALMQPVFSRYLKIVGGWEWGIALFERSDHPVPMIPYRYSTEANAHYALEAIQRGEVRVTPLITQRIRPDEIQAAYQGLLHDREQFVGVLIDWT